MNSPPVERPPATRWLSPRRVVPLTLGVLVLLGLCLTTAIRVTRTARPPSTDALGRGDSAVEWKDAHEILAWAAGQTLKPESDTVLALPRAWVARTARGTLHVGRSASGRTCVLLVKSAGWKDNFTGVVSCDRPLSAAELVAASGPRPYLSLPGEGVFEELYVSQRHRDRDFEIYFDLN